MNPTDTPAASAPTWLARLPIPAALRALPKSALLAAGAALAVALIVIAVLYSRGPDYKVLFANLDERDGAAIVAALNQMHVPYKFADQGGALLVPADQVHETRLQLAGLGLPRGGAIGFELLDQSHFGASQFSEQITYQRGLEGELARSIQAMHSVARARVHLALPRQSLFIRDRQPPTASVLLHVQPGRTVSESQVSAIAWLVSASVPGLNAEQVSIVDQNGRLLSAPGGEARGMDAEQLRYVRDIEQRTIERILTLLNPLVGVENVHAQASAEVDFAQREETSEIYRPNQEPGQAAIRSEQTSEARERDALLAQGIPGALSNQPPVNATAPIVNPPGGGDDTPPAPAAPGNERRDATRNYEVDRTISHVKQSVGTLQRLSVAVVLNYRPDADGTMQPLAPEEIDKLEKLVRDAMGYSDARGDSLNLTNSLFSAADPEPPFWRDAAMIALAKELLGYLILALALFWVWRAVVRPLLQRHVEPVIDAAVLDEAASEASLEADKAARIALRARYEDTLEAAREIARKDPRSAAMVLRAWMNKDAG